MASNTALAVPGEEEAGKCPSGSVVPLCCSMFSFLGQKVYYVAQDFDVKFQLKFLNPPSQSPSANFFQNEDSPFVINVGTSFSF